MEEIKEIDPRVEKIVELRNKRVADIDELKSLKNEYDKVCSYKNSDNIDAIRIVPELYGKESERVELFFGDRSIPLVKNLLKATIEALKETLEDDMKRLKDEICQIDSDFKEMLSDEFKLPPVKSDHTNTERLRRVKNDPYSETYGGWLDF